MRQAAALASAAHGPGLLSAGRSLRTAGRAENLRDPGRLRSRVTPVTFEQEPMSQAADRATGKREQTKQQNRRAILDAARAVFSELGYETATVRDIIRRTGLAAGTFYNY